MSKQSEKTVGMVGLFDEPNALIRAAERVRDEGFTRWDCHTPFPVHGLDRAMGLKASPVPTLALTGGFIGLLAAVALTFGLNVIDYPIRIAGKPMFSWQAFVPIYFELFVLFAALTIMGSLFLFCGLGRWHSPLHDSDIMKQVTGDRLLSCWKQLISATPKRMYGRFLRKRGVVMFDLSWNSKRRMAGVYEQARSHRQIA